VWCEIMAGRKEDENNNGGKKVARNMAGRVVDM
jgi:hypothetical protein